MTRPLFLKKRQEKRYKQVIILEWLLVSLCGFDFPHSSPQPPWPSVLPPLLLPHCVLQPSGWLAASQTRPPGSCPPDVSAVSPFAISPLSCSLFPAHSYSSFKVQPRCHCTQKPPVISSPDRFGVPPACSKSIPNNVSNKPFTYYALPVFCVFFFPF